MKSIRLRHIILFLLMAVFVTPVRAGIHTVLGGNLQQRTDYYPFGTPFSSPSSTINAGLQPFKYNNKELDMMHGLNTYDYGARQYYPLLPMWDRVDPLAEDNPGVSPYMYCAGDPVNKFDPDGRECGPGDKFDKLDDAAKDFGKCYNETSIENDKEMSTSFYKTTSLVSSGMPKDPNDPIKVEDAMKFYQ